MAKVSFSVDSNLPAEAVLAATTDFTDKRLRYWPKIDPKLYRLHSKTSTTADVTEGSFGRIWARESYDWSQPNTVRAIVLDSNVFRRGGTWELRATPRSEGGCQVEVTIDRVARTTIGRVIGAMLAPLEPKLHRISLRRTLDIIAKETVASAMTKVGVR